MLRMIRKVALLTRLNLTFPKLIVVVAFFICLSVLLMTREEDRSGLAGSSCPVGEERRLRYGIMLDAGSTGSRIHVYKFIACGVKVQSVVDEVFQHITPGLSSFGANPEKAPESLKELMQAAVDSVPKELQRCTPLALKATAGLRLLSESKANIILDHVKRYLETFPFPVDAVNVMEGSEEGVSAWITVNFLLGRLKRSKTTDAVSGNWISQSEKHETALIMDMGGASTQIVFETRGIDLVSLGQEKHSAHLNFGGEDFRLYQHSYLGYGLNEARKKIFEHSSSSSGCLPSSYKHDFSGRSIAGTGVLSDCLRTTRDILKLETTCKAVTCSFSGVYQPNLKLNGYTRNIYGFSFFYDRLTPLLHHNVVTIREVYSLASKICNTRYKSTTSSSDSIEEQMVHSNPLYCLDLAYIYTLWKDGYGIPENQPITLAKKIREFETGWTLGETIQLLESSKSSVPCYS